MSTVLDSQKYLSVQEAADVLGVTDGRIRQMLLEGSLVGQKLGRHVWAIPGVEVERAKGRRQWRNRGLKTDATSPTDSG
jgi:excisionase family DNA binding protein